MISLEQRSPNYSPGATSGPPPDFIRPVDVIGHMNQLNLNLQNEENLVGDIFGHVKAIRPKLTLLEVQMKVQNFAHFPCENFHAESEVEFPSSFATEIIIVDFQRNFMHDILTLIQKQMKSGSFNIHLIAALSFK